MHLDGRLARDPHPAVSTADRILDVIDAGLQSSDEHGYGTDHTPDRCARCQRHEPDLGDLCTGCRSFLLGDSDDDPSRFVPRSASPEILFVTAMVVCPNHGNIGEAQAMDLPGMSAPMPYRLHINGLFYSGFIGFGPAPQCPACDAPLHLDNVMEHRPLSATRTEPCQGFDSLSEQDHMYVCSRVRGTTVQSHLHPRMPRPASEDTVSLRFDYSAS